MTSRVKGYIIFHHSKDNFYKFINHSYHSFFMTSKLVIFDFVVVFKNFISGYNTCCHLIKDISQKWISLFRDTFFKFPFTRLFNHRISSSIFDKFFSIREFFDIFYFSKEKSTQFFGDTFYRAKDMDLIFRVFRDFIFKSFFKFYKLIFKEEELFNKEF